MGNSYAFAEVLTGLYEAIAWGYAEELAEFDGLFDLATVAGRQRMLARRSAMEHMHNYSPSLADAFISIHVNAGGGRGAETFCYWWYGAGGRLAALLQNQLVMAMQPLDKGYLDRGIKERPSLCVLRETMMPAALVELGFIDSADVWLLKEHQEDMAKALALGIMDYWKTV